jgi:hypothetical protein
MHSNPSMNNMKIPTSSVVQAIRHVLRPLVRMMVSSGVAYPFVADLLKELFVEVANREFRLGDQKPTDSRISLITGVHRKDVRRLRESGPSRDGRVPDSISFGSQLVAAWLGNERFMDEHGQPRPLQRMHNAGNEVSLEELVASRSKDIRSRVVLDEWLRLGIVHMDDKDRVVLNTEAFVPSTGLEEKLHFFAHNLHDHAATATANLLGDRPAQLERSVFYDGLVEASINLLDRRAQQLGTKLLKDLNRSAMEFEANDATSSEPRRRFTCGVYFYSEPAATVSED